MKLKTYIKELQKIANEHPNLTVVASSDDDGNSFNPVRFVPSIGHFRVNEGFIPDDGTEDAPKPNTVCLN